MSNDNLLGTDTGNGTFETDIPYTDGKYIVDGYKKPGAKSGQLTITGTPANNVLNITYGVDPTQLFAYKILYRISGTVDPVPGTPDASGTGYVGQIITVPLPDNGSGYKACSGQPATLTVTNDNAASVTVQYEVDQSQTFDYVVSFLLSGSSIQAPGAVNQTGKGYVGQIIAIITPAVAGYKLVTGQPATITVKHDGSASQNIFYEIDSTQWATLTFKPGIHAAAGQNDSTVSSIKGKTLAEQGLSLPTFTAGTGWKQNGWDPGIAIGTVVSGDGEYTAQWIKDPAQCNSVTYNGYGNDGGTVPSDSEIYYQGETVTVKAGIPVKTGCNFSGWTLGSDPAVYVEGGTFSMPGTAVILKAKWSTNTYTVAASAGANGSISPNGNVTVNHDASQTFTFEPGSNYLVNTLTVDGVAVINPGNQYTFSNVTADHTIAVTFKLKTYAISYDGNGAVSGAVPGTAVVFNGKYTLEGNTGSLARPGYAFAGWSGIVGGDVTLSVTVNNADVTVYASWKANVYIVTLVDGTGTSSFKATYGSGVLAGYVPPSKAGSVFEGYWTALTGGSAVIMPDGKYASGVTGYTSAGKWAGLSDCTLYARWTDVPKTAVSLDLAGASSGSSATELEFGSSAVPSTYVKPANGNREFLGYFVPSGALVIKADGTLSKGVAGLTDGAGKWIMKGGSIGLKAGWGVSKTSVALDLNGTTYGSAGIVMIGGMTSTPPEYIEPKNYSHDFTGYFTGSGMLVIKAGGALAPGVNGFTDDTGSWICPDVSVTLHARWVAAVGPDPGPAPEGAVKYHANGGTFDGTVETIDGESFIKFEKLPAREGYTFLGWAETPDAKVPKYTPDKAVVPAYFNVDLYSVWVLNEPAEPSPGMPAYQIALAVLLSIAVIALAVVGIRRLRSG